MRESAKHQGGIHPICGDGAACTAPDHAENHENIAWTPVEYIHTETHGTEEWIEPGNYYLTKDTILANSAYSRKIVVTGDVKICLNGHTLKYRPRTTDTAGLCRNLSGETTPASLSATARRDKTARSFRFRMTGNRIRHCSNACGTARPISLAAKSAAAAAAARCRIILPIQAQ